MKTVNTLRKKKRPFAHVLLGTDEDFKDRLENECIATGAEERLESGHHRDVTSQDRREEVFLRRVELCNSAEQFVDLHKIPVMLFGDFLMHYRNENRLTLA